MHAQLEPLREAFSLGKRMQSKDDIWYQEVAHL